MKYTYRIKMRMALWAALGTVCFVSVPPVAFGGWAGETMCACPGRHKPLGNNATCEDACYGTRSSPGGNNSAPGYDYGAAERAREAEAERQRQIEAERVERERQAEIKRQKDAAFIRDRDAAASTLKGSTGSAMNQLKGLAGTDNSGLKGSAFDTGSTGLKGSGIEAGSAPTSTNRKARLKPAPHTDTSVVDARNVPSGLPKGLDKAIANAYANAPPGVSDRVRKGFQAVMERDWKVAKAWFQDALNRDPDNAGLKRLVALTDATQAPLKGATVPPNKAKSASPSTTDLQLPDPDDIRFLFPGLQAMKDKEKPVFKTLPDGRRVQMPQDSDMEFLFGPQGAASASAPKPTPTFIIGKNGQLIQVPENSNQKSTTYIKGKDGELIAVPQPQDNLLMFPGNSPTTTPKSAGESGKTK